MIGKVDSSQSEIVKFLEYRLFRLRSSTGQFSRVPDYTIIAVPFAKGYVLNFLGTYLEVTFTPHDGTWR